MNDDAIFFPHYINQARLFDLYAILNGGYPEYEEVQSATSSESKKSAKAELSGNGGFHLFKIAGNMIGGVEKGKQNSESAMIHRVQTVTSILDLTIKNLRDRGFIAPIKEADTGSFILVPVNLKINSIKTLLNEANDLMKLAQDIATLDTTSNRNSKSGNSIPNSKQLERIVGVAKELFNSEEIVHIDESHALFGNINPGNLYQSERADIINIDLQCLAQVKRIFPQGTQLMRNTIFSKIKDAKSKTQLIDILANLPNATQFEFDTVAIPEISDKPTYQVEVVALFQQAKSNASN